ncbi:hypothetical protein C3Y94_028105 [Rhizobium ruizarguesonis]|uniref:hypothetical protein n=1 Tax=Rhizobium ruizarguesonis TaxID=2081791 RepID=UPI001639A8E1|nr:hypothetical protein [Rhizobium ruizarguesonis]MBC2806997.1 hypothetical protein [Rhizobium ruizarguesonis]
MDQIEPTEVRMQSGCWSRIQPYILPVLIFVAPILVVALARFIFEDIIEVGRLDVEFLPGSAFAGPHPMMFISAAVTSSLYNFGFALCAAMVFSVALTAYGSVIVWLAASSKWLRGAYIVMLVIAFAFAVFDFQKLRLADDHVPAEIARNLIDRTLDHLPTCDLAESQNLPPCVTGGIGNTGNSLERVVALGLGAVLVAGLSFLMAVAITAGSMETSENDRKARIESITLLAAMTFLLTIVAVHLLFQPGADMITAAYAPMKPQDIVQLQDYASLRSAMTLYWATIFSLALGTAYFCAVTFVQGQAKGAIDFGSVWNVVKALLTVLSPVIADWALKLGEALIETVSH